MNSDDLDRRMVARGRPYKVEVPGVPAFYFRYMADIGPFLRGSFPRAQAAITNLNLPQPEGSVRCQG